MSLKDIRSLSTDDRPCLNWEPAILFDVLRECCIPSLLDTVLTEALGLQNNLLLCNNEACRRVILAQGAVAQEFVHFNKRDGEGDSQVQPHLGVQHALLTNNNEDKYLICLMKSTSQPWEGIEKLQVRILKGFDAIEAVSETTISETHI